MFCLICKYFIQFVRQGSEADKPSAGLTTVHFQKSVKMVTYLACFIVCDFEERIGETVNNKIPFRVISRPDQIKSTEYPLDVGIKVTDYYEDYFGLRYALPKQGKRFLDRIQIRCLHLTRALHHRHDCHSGFREWRHGTLGPCNLSRNGSPVQSDRKLYGQSKTSCHSHRSWIGSSVVRQFEWVPCYGWINFDFDLNNYIILVTVRWWDDLWLNEGFASYMEYKGTNDVHPDWDIVMKFHIRSCSFH